MEQENPYAASRADLLEEIPTDELVLASKWSRLGAAWVDGLLYGVCMIPVLFFFGFGKLADPAWAQSVHIKLLFLACGIPAYALNFYFVNQSGQTVGKKVAKIRMVRSDGSRLDGIRWFGLRMFPLYVVSQFPTIGPLVAIANALWIFGKSRRCLHDLVADTIVVKA